MQCYQTSFSACVGQTDTENIIGLGTYQYCVDHNEFEKSLRLLVFLRMKKRMNEIKSFMEANKIEHDIFDKLVANKLITSFILNPNDKQNFKNHLFIDLMSNKPELTINNFKRTIFIIIGCGGIGNFVSYALASFYPKKLILLDKDTVDPSNLNRQFLFDKNYISQYKTSTIKQALSSRFDINIEIVDDFASEYNLEEIFSKHKKENLFGIVSGDNPNTVQLATRFFCKCRIPFLNIGYLNDISLIGPFYIPSLSCCPFCHNSFALDDKKDSDKNLDICLINDRMQAPSSFLNNSIASSLAISDIIQFMSDDFNSIKSLNCRFGVDNKTFKTYTLLSSIDHKCVFCSNHNL
ncbi:ThiF family adenylyltransferase [Helicobacter pylori]|uniref:ThiF family adenylyltransferase n=1 Tax=Helicobacter pylori TaxID=210 RepID=UPI00100AEAE9|nr:ThiF family adenylyltransferase [Helicobacter pylori]